VVKRKFFQIISSLKTFILSKNFLTFLVFLFLAFCFWCMQSMRKKYEVDINIKITYVNAPVSNINADDLPKYMTATLKEQGFYIFVYKRKNMEIVLDFDDFNYDKNTYCVSSDVLQNKLKNILMQSTQVVDFTPSEVFIKSVKKTGKTVPVKFGGTVSFAQQYSQSDTILLSPKEISVFGDEKILDTLKCVYTENKEYANLKSSITEKAKLTAIKGTSFSTVNVNVTIPVERFTERTIETQIKGINIPDGLTLRTFPTNTKVSYFISASKFNTDDKIEVFVDYKDILTNKTGKLTLKTKTTNPFISNIRCKPNEIEFLLEK